MAAQTFFRAELSKLEQPKLEQIFEVLSKADIILYVVNQISDATQIFELLNDRGRRLSPLEGIKSFLMYKISSLRLKEFEQPINDIQGNFSSIYRLIEQYSINENEVLRFHTIAFEKTKIEDYNKPTVYIKSKIHSMFDSSVPDNEIKTEIVNYVKRLKKSFDIYKNIKTNSLKSKTLDKFFMIGRVNPFYPFLMIIYDSDKSKLENFIYHLNKFTFKAAMIGLQNKNESFYRNIRDNHDLFEVFKAPVMSNWWNMNARFDNALTYTNFYEYVNKNIVKYILFEYENSLRQTKGYPLLTIKNYFETDERAKFSIEHITAQKSKELLFDDDFKENYLHSLGNLVIDSKAPNSSKGNNNVDQKIIEYNKAPIMSQNELNGKTVNWSSLEEVKQFISDRNKELIKFVQTLAGIETLIE